MRKRINRRFLSLVLSGAMVLSLSAPPQLTLSAFAAPANEVEGSQAEELRLNKAATPSDAEKPDDAGRPENPDTDKPDTDESENTGESGNKNETGSTTETPEKPGYEGETKPETSVKPENPAHPDETEHATSSEAAKPSAKRVQKLIDALPAAEDVTKDNLASVQKKLDAIERAMSSLSDEELADLDVANYDAVKAAVEALKVPTLMQAKALAAPTNVKWAASLDGTATWDAVEGATGYEVQLYQRYAADNPGPSTGKIGDAISVSGKDNTSCKLIYDNPGNYYFTVKATNESGSSPEAKSGEMNFNIANAEFVTITFTDTFLSGNVLFTREVKPGELLAEPEAPSKPGYRFNGWWITPDRKFDFTKPITGSATLYPAWIAESADLPRPDHYYWESEVGRVTWDKVEGAAGYGLQLFGTNDGGKTKWRIGDEVTVGADKTEYTFPIDNIYHSYLINIWAVDQNGRKGQIGVGSTPRSYDKVNVDYVTVTLDAQGGTEVAPIKVKVGDKISFPKSKKDGYNLQGWTYDTGERWSFNDPVMSSMTLKAVWANSNIPYPKGLTWNIRDIGLVKWNSVSGAAGYQVQLYGDEFEDRYEIGDPVQLKGANTTTYHFIIDSIYHPYSFGVRVMDQNGNLGPETLTRGITLPYVNVRTVDVKWDANGGRPSPLATLKISVGTRITDVVEPHQPVKDGYRLMGWVNKETGKVWNMNDPVVSAMTLVAVWGQSAVDNNTALTSFYIGNTKGVISGKTITVKLPRGSKIPTEPTTFRATFANTTNNAVIADMETKNGGKTWTFKVQTKDGKYFTNYTLYVSVQSSSGGGGGGGGSSSGGGGGGGGGSSSGGSFSGSGVNTFGGPGAVSQTLAPNGNWESDTNGWKFKTTAGAYPTDNWYECVWNNEKNWYHFDANGYLNSGWFTDKDGQTYYLHDVHDNAFGYMYTGWHWIGGKCYYFNPVSGTNGLMKGVLFKNTTTPDGYTVDATGAWTVNGVVQTQQ